VDSEPIPSEKLPVYRKQFYFALSLAFTFALAAFAPWMAAAQAKPHQHVAEDSRFNSHSLTASYANASGLLQVAVSEALQKQPQDFLVPIHLRGCHA
jgi:hypothetical protein